MTFKKYPSIENHYQTKFIEHFKDEFPNIENQQYIVREKLDGANIQLIFQPNQKMLVATRNRILEEGEKFNDIWNVLKRYEKLFETVNQQNKFKQTISLFGEIYGKGIQNRVNYGDDKYISIFDCYINNAFITQGDLEMMAENCFFSHLLPKSFGIFNNLQEALDVELTDNIEGIVIQPYNKNYFSNGGSRFIIKKKSESFEDGKRNKIIKPVDKDVQSLNGAFRTFINENRMLDTFSKYGEIQTPKDIGKYIKLILEDAKEDFLKSYNINKLVIDLDKNKEKAILNVGSDIVNLLKSKL